MTVRQWYLGIAAVAAAALIPLSANATAVPNFISFESNGSGHELELKIVGVTNENFSNLNNDPDSAGTGDGINGGSCNAGLTNCLETTYGAGIITSVGDLSSGLNTWSTGDQGVAVAFVLWGVADKSVTGTDPQDIKNLGATAAAGTEFDGSIHLDLYYMDSSSTPCFTDDVSCDAFRRVATSDRVGQSGFTHITTGVTGGSTLFASYVMVPGVDSDLTVTMDQSFKPSTLKGDGNFYANCTDPSLPLCQQFSPGRFATDFGGTFADILGGFHINPALTAQSNIGWFLRVDDPVNAWASIPEPASLGLLGAALAFFGVAIHRRRKGMSA